MFLIFTILFTGLPSLALVDGDMQKDLSENRENELIIKFKEDANSTESTSSYSGLEAGPQEIDGLTRLVKLEEADLDGLIESLEKNPRIEYVEKNYIYRQASIPNDPYYPYLWHLDKVRAKDAWSLLEEEHEEEVVVAVIDSGIDYYHPDLVNRIVPGGYNFFNNSRDFYDYSGHGSFVAGIIAAEANNNYGITGLAGEANIKLLPLSVFDYRGESTVYDIVRAIDYSIEKGVDVINLSLGGPSYSYAFKDAIERALRADIVVVAAAGNEALKGNSIFYPASYDGVLSVGASNRNNERATFSNYNEFLDLVAPGEDIFSTYPSSSFSSGSGSSYAGPMVSATAALLKSLNPELSVDDIRDILTETAEDLGPLGRDPYYGYGLLNMERALASISSPSDDLKGYRDLEEINAGDQQVLRVEFNYELDKTSLEDSIFMSSSSSGSTRDLSYSIKLDAREKNIVYLLPKGRWKPGYNYLFITEGVRSLDGRQHRESLRIKVLVD